MGRALVELYVEAGAQRLARPRKTAAVQLIFKDEFAAAAIRQIGRELHQPLCGVPSEIDDDDPQISIQSPTPRREIVARPVAGGMHLEKPPFSRMKYVVVGRCQELLVEAPQRLVGRFVRSEEHTSELQSQSNLVCRRLLEKKKSRRT